MEIFTFVIDTDRYAGDLAPFLADYVLGRMENAKVPTYASMWFKKMCRYLKCRDGISRVYSLVETPGWFHDGLGDLYCDEGFDRREYTKKYNLKVCAYIEANLRAGVMGPADRTEYMRTHPPVTGVRRWPAYLSVGIHMDKVPLRQIVELMKRRAKEFAESCDVLALYSGWPAMPQFKVRGFRMIRQDDHLAPKAKKVEALG